MKCIDSVVACLKYRFWIRLEAIKYLRIADLAGNHTGDHPNVKQGY
jgi:hypothetical protein